MARLPAARQPHRRRRHRRNGSFGSSGYPAAQPACAPCQPAVTGSLSPADAEADTDADAMLT